MLYTREQLDDLYHFVVRADGEVYVFPKCAYRDYSDAVSDYVAEGYPWRVARLMACCEVQSDLDDSREVASYT